MPKNREAVGEHTLDCFKFLMPQSLDPHPQPLPTTGRGAHRARGTVLRPLRGHWSSLAFAYRNLWNLRSFAQSGLMLGRPDHLAPFRGLVGDEPGEIHGQAGERGDAQIGEPSLQSGISDGGVDLPVQSFDELRGRVFRSADAVPPTRLVARQGFAQSRNVRQRLRALRRGDRQGAQLGVPDIPDR
jgi:hypothetical protein